VLKLSKAERGVLTNQLADKMRPDEAGTTAYYTRKPGIVINGSRIQTRAMEKSLPGGDSSLARIDR